MTEQYNIEADAVEEIEVEMVEISAKELADLRKSLERAESNYKYINQAYSEVSAEIRRIHEILDNLPHKAPRSEPKTEENQWPAQYNAPTRLAIWLGSKW